MDCTGFCSCARFAVNFQAAEDPFTKAAACREITVKEETALKKSGEEVRGLLHRNCALVIKATFVLWSRR